MLGKTASQLSSMQQQQQRTFWLQVGARSVNSKSATDTAWFTLMLCLFQQHNGLETEETCTQYNILKIARSLFRQVLLFLCQSRSTLRACLLQEQQLQGSRTFL